MNFPPIPTSYFEVLGFRAIDSCPIPCSTHVSYRLSCGVCNRHVHQSLWAHMRRAPASLFPHWLMKVIPTSIYLLSVISPRWLHNVWLTSFISCRWKMVILTIVFRWFWVSHICSSAFIRVCISSMFKWADERIWLTQNQRDTIVHMTIFHLQEMKDMNHI